MASPTQPTYRTGWLWTVLTVLLVLGVVASGLVVYGLTDLLPGRDWVGAAAAVLLGAFVALLAFLLLAGILYRIDRLRGTPHRVVRMFE